MWKFGVDGVKWGRSTPTVRQLWGHTLMHDLFSSAFTDTGIANIVADEETMPRLIKAAGGWQVRFHLQGDVFL